MKRRRVSGPPRGPSLRKEGNVGAALRDGNIVAYPTESFYALGVDATSPKAIQQLFRLKRREKNKPIALIAGNLKQVKKFFYMSVEEIKLAKKYWPGSLTMLLCPKKTVAARALGVSVPPPGPSYDRRGVVVRPRRVLVGVRVPAHVGARALALRIGAPITATSANISGQPPTKSARKVKRDFPDILVMPGRCGKQRLPSTVVRIDGQHIRIIRSGSIHL